MLKKDDSNLFIMVDQFEEIFRFGLNTEDAERREQTAGFVALLLRLAEQDEFPVFICLTIRSDCLGDCDAYAGLPEAMNRSHYLVPRLTRTQRREAIAGPVHLAGATMAPRLLDRLLNESGIERDDLSVLQHALLRTWMFWEQDADGPLDVTHYDHAKTIKKALDKHANEAYDDLDASDKELTKRMFQVLTETDPGNRRIRRPTHLNDLAAICYTTPGKLLPIIERFREDQRNFLVLSSENAQENPLVDISHESLIRQWGRLSEWADEEAEPAQTYRDYMRRAHRNNKGDGSLLTGSDLDYALKWQREQNKQSFLVRTFLGKTYWTNAVHALKQDDTLKLLHYNALTAGY